MSASADRGFEFSGTDRFEVLRCLGAGGMGVVYEAFDRERQARVALKTLRSMSADGLLRFKREFRDFLDLAHPNLISLGELFSEGRDWFFTMELVEGRTFLDWVRPAPGKAKTPSFSRPSLVNAKTVAEFTPRLRDADLAPLDLERLRAALAQLVEGVMALHAAEKVHRDIKPSNVLVTPDGRVVLLDFGLATETRREEQLSSTDVVGTVEYMAPEQAAARPIGPPADWYAVGVMLYEALTGEVPFSGAALEVLMNKQRLEPTPPSLLQPSTPPELDRLAQDLLALRSGAPPRRARDPAPARRRAGAGRRNASRPSMTSTPPFVGRAAELVELRAAFEASRAGAVTVHVHGESGVGKSALVRRFTEMLKAELPDAVVLGGACYERESVPYKAVDGVIDALSRYLVTLDKAEAGVGAAAAGGALDDGVPGAVARRAVRRCAARLRGARSAGAASRLFGALRELFARLADRKPLVVSIDDLQWADADSLALLAEVLRPPEAPALLLLATVRDARPSAEPSGAQAIEPGARRRAPPAARAHVGRGGARAGAAAHRARGRAARHRRARRRRGGGRPPAVHRRAHPPLGGGRARRRCTSRRRCGRASGGSSRRRASVLELTALAGGRLVQATAAQAANLDTASFGKQVGLLRVAHLVRTTGTRGTDYIEPYHDRVRAAVLSHLRRRQRPRAAPAAGARARGGRARRSRGARAALARSRRTRRAPPRTRRKPRSRRPARSPSIAPRSSTATASRSACRATPSGPRSARAARRRAGQRRPRRRGGRALPRSGQLGLARRRARSAPPRRRAAVALGPRRRRPDRAPHRARRGRDEAARTRPRSALGSLLLRRARIRLRGLRFVERDESQLSAEMLTRIDTCWSAAAGLSMVDTIRCADFQARHLLLALDAGEPYRIARALAMEGGLVSVSGGPAAETRRPAPRRGEAARDPHRTSARSRPRRDDRRGRCLRGRPVGGRAPPAR